MAERTITADDLAQILAAHPTLGANGYDHPACRQPDKRALDRQRLTGRLDEVQAAYNWITTLRRARITSDTPTSYGLKHEGKRAGIGYVSNGAMIAAAYLAGVRVKIRPGSANPQLGVTTAPAPVKPPAGSFTAWLAKQRDQDNPVGDLARDADGSEGWPLTGDYTTYWEYLSRVGASSGAMESLKLAWTAYSGSEPTDPDADEEWT